MHSWKFPSKESWQATGTGFFFLQMGGIVISVAGGFSPPALSTFRILSHLCKGVTWSLITLHLHKSWRNICFKILGGVGRPRGTQLLGFIYTKVFLLKFELYSYKLGVLFQSAVIQGKSPWGTREWQGRAQELNWILWPCNIKQIPWDTSRTLKKKSMHINLAYFASSHLTFSYF